MPDFGSSPTGNIVALAFNNVIDRPFSLFIQRSPFFKALAGEQVTLEQEDVVGYKGYQRFNDDITGNKQELTFKVEGGIGSPVARGSATVGSRSASYVNYFGKAEAAVTHYPWAIDVSVPEMDLIDGKSKKSIDILSGILEIETDKMVRTVHYGLHGKNADGTFTPRDQSDSYLGSWTYAVSDCTTNVSSVTDETGNASYFGVTRTSSPNQTLKGRVAQVMGTAGSFMDIMAAVANASLYSSEMPFIVCDQAAYLYWWSLADSQAKGIGTQIEGNTTHYGGRSFIFAGCCFVLDPYAPVHMGILVPSTWKLKLKMKPLPMGSFNRNQTTVASYLGQTDMYAWLACRNPAANTKLLRPASGTWTGV